MYRYAGDLADAANQVDEMREKLLAEFESWWQEVAPEGAETDMSPFPSSPGFSTGFSGFGLGSPGGASQYNFTKMVDEQGDPLDDAEAFEKLEMERVANTDPDSLAYFNAQKSLHATSKTRRSRRIR